MTGTRHRRAANVPVAGFLRSYEATGMIEGGTLLLDGRGIMPTPELPTLRQPRLLAQ